MTDETVSVEIWQLYAFKRIVERCALIAHSVEEDTEELMLPQSAFTRVGDAKKIYKAWQALCSDRKSEAKALKNELEDVAKMLEDIAELYGWTDAELARIILKTRLE